METAGHWTMKPKEKVCTNCGGSEFYTRWVKFDGEASALMPLGPVDRSLVGSVLALAMQKPALCQLRICGKCGLAQWFVEKESLDLVKENYEREP